jgi:hypothetical protein
MSNEDLFEDNGKNAPIEDGEMLYTQDYGETKCKKWVVSIIAAKTDSSFVLERHLDGSPHFVLGHRSRADVKTIRNIALSPKTGSKRGQGRTFAYLGLAPELAFGVRPFSPRWAPTQRVGFRASASGFAPPPGLPFRGPGTLLIKTRSS